MGSSASKASNAASKLPAAATNTARRYPTRTPSPTSTTNARSPSPNLGPTVHPEPELAAASEVRDQAIARDASDPDLALNARLRALGPVQPNPTSSNSSAFSFQPPSSSSATDNFLASSQFQSSASSPQQKIYPTIASGASNPAVSLLTARYRLAAEAEQEFAHTGKSSGEGRRFLDVYTLRQILVLRDERGVEGMEIERRLGLRRGVVEQLGGRGVVGIGS